MPTQSRAQIIHLVTSEKTILEYPESWVELLLNIAVGSSQCFITERVLVSSNEEVAVVGHFEERSIE